MNLTERLTKYVKVYTTSDENSETFPSTKRQFDLAHILVDELKELGLKDASVDEYGYVTAHLDGNTDKKMPTLGLLAHMDTSPAAKGENVNPQIVHYEGGDIVLNKDKNIVLSPEDFPALDDVVGLDLMVTDGTTLLGADDKAGIAIIMDTLKTVIEKNLPHGPLAIGFTPDEEIGRGVDKFDVEKFGADIAFTLDGSRLGEVQYECFHAVSGKVDIQGVSVHPGSAKGQMINAIALGMELDGMLPEQMRPQYTEGYEGFFHLDQFRGNVEQAEMIYIIRDFDAKKVEKMCTIFESAVDFLNTKYGDRVKLTLDETYRNMREKIEPHMDLIDLCVDVMKEEGIEPVVEPIRGGTDGSKLSWMGLPTPNLFTGGMNFHGPYEYIPIQHMEKGRDFLVSLLQAMEKRA
ncbi:peptidase T [Aedoeadaptatus coxii]|uniref:Peptidase T n=1 Tax=Aedoeadaptatus coxii TaxID=755172 RepID=A0A134AGQ9_9FIRM|nr:peptidase T [Peptoniphilus coxii]KXB66835.1 peptidase T [Peptoniphilus coxii]